MTGSTILDLILPTPSSGPISPCFPKARRHRTSTYCALREWGGSPSNQNPICVFPPLQGTGLTLDMVSLASKNKRTCAFFSRRFRSAGLPQVCSGRSCAHQAVRQPWSQVLRKINYVKLNSLRERNVRKGQQPQRISRSFYMAGQTEIASCIGHAQVISVAGIMSIVTR